MSTTSATLTHYKKLFCKLVGFNENKIDISSKKSILHKHSGFGSNVTTNTACFYALNQLFGNPFTSKEIYKILISNYVENDENNSQKIYFGFDTGLGEASVLFGGFVLADIKANYVGNIKDSSLYVLTAVADKSRLIIKDSVKSRKITEKSETETLRNAKSKTIDFQKENNRKLHQLRNNMQIIFSKKDRAALYKNIWDINKLGIYDYMRNKYDSTILDKFIEIAKNNSALFAGISSAGPSMFVITRNNEIAIKIKQKLKAELSDYFTEFEIGKAGEKIRVVNSQLINPSFQ